jgi:hypothetical protein
MPDFDSLTDAGASIDDQIRALEEFVRTLDPVPTAPAAPELLPEPPAPLGREADLARAKALIDQAIDLIAPHFPTTVG